MEMVDKFDNKRFSLNKVTERYEQIKGEYGQSMHLWIQNDKGEFLIQKRSPTKKVFPNLWSITGGGVDTGETTLDAVYRECKEELGVTALPENLELLMSIKREYTFLDIYLLRQNIDLKDVVLQKEEVSDVKWVSLDELRNLMKRTDFTTNLDIYFDTMLNIIEKYQ